MLPDNIHQFYFYLVIILFIISFFISLWQEKFFLHMLQQNLYNENNRYKKWLQKKSFKMFFATQKKSFGTKVPLSWTFRSVRIYLLSLLITFFLFFFYLEISHEYLPQINFLFLIISLIYSLLIIFFSPLLIYVSYLINLPLDKLLNLIYLKKASRYLSKFPNLKIIGITGSYGKTTTKNILQTILSSQYNTCVTPENFNTPLGLAKTITHQLSALSQIFIAEMGAYVPGEIKKMVDLIHPQYGIITFLGPMHLESFGSQEKITATKFELLAGLPSDGLGVFNYDDVLQTEYLSKNRAKFKANLISISLNHPQSDYFADEIKTNYLGTTFICHLPQKRIIHLETKLLGKANIYNLLASIAIADHLNISLHQIKTAIKKIAPVPGRLELKKVLNFWQINDGYNSNPDGAKIALDVLETFPGRHFIVTPGMIELGSQQNLLNQKFGQQIARINPNQVILIGKKQTEFILKGLAVANFDKNKILILDHRDQAINYIKKYVQDSSDQSPLYVLFENDLPDSYNE